MTLINGGRIVASTNSAGDAGDVMVTAGSLLIDGAGSFAGIVTNTGLGSGNGGDIKVDVTGNVTIMAGGEISTGSLAGTGSGGAIRLAAPTITTNKNGALSAAGGLSTCDPGSSLPRVAGWRGDRRRARYFLRFNPRTLSLRAAPRVGVKLTTSCTRSFTWRRLRSLRPALPGLTLMRTVPAAPARTRVWPNTAIFGTVVTAEMIPGA